jgi:hypothetical protein
MVPEIRAELKLHPDVHSLDDEWSGITDPVVRRKLQNRLNQRAASMCKGLKEKLQTADPTNRTTQGCSKCGWECEPRVL